MTDMDRLREAADTQDDFGEGAAIAALLRAVADEWDSTGPGTWDAALDLADAILRPGVAVGDVSTTPTASSPARRDCACGGDMATVHHSPECCSGPECSG